MSRDSVTESQPDVMRVQEELLEMLRMAGNEAPPPRREVVAPEPAPVVSHAPAKRTCAKCGSEKPWGKSNWCPDCGFYPKAGFAGTGVAEAEDDKPPPKLIDILPEWAIPMAVGAGTLFVTSVIFRFVFYDALTRSFVAIAQFLVSAMAVIVVHCRSSYIAVNSGRSWMAFVNPTETWMLMSQMKKKWLIVVAGVGLVGLATSFLIGPDPEMIVKQIQKDNKGKKMTFSSLMSSLTGVAKKAFGKDFAGKQFAMQTVGKLISATGKASGGADVGGFEDALGGLAGKADLFTGGSDTQAITDANAAPAEPPPTEEETDEEEESEEGADAQANSAATPPPTPGKAAKSKSSGGKDTGKSAVISGGAKGTSVGLAKGPSADDKADSLSDKETLDCWVYGYTANAEGEVRSLLLATKTKTGSLKFFQKLALDSLSDEALKKLNDDLKPFRTKTPAIRSPYVGKWVKPVVGCRVAHDGMNTEERPTNPEFHSLILP
ncbi:MAG: hypothetical protein U0929_08050 [Planctomycetaceae bacterium]